ncbi:hypothetical protein LPUS_08959 [Lasallia pustulata]|uniref:Uncharacterized protein n=1 Tax=Lasallia pustulata TaxID=136370 RepID=A0A1W5D6M0_9LECA|nr:hypothetical protein LPUS_08959 [Lasallia pustulata]
MRSSIAPPTLLSLLATVLSSTHTAIAKPLPQGESVLEAQNNTLEERGCQYSCGWSGQLCCQYAGACYTDVNGQAQCSAANSVATTSVVQSAAQGQWTYWTTTYVETDLLTITTVYSSFVGQQSTQVLVPQQTTWVAANSPSAQQPQQTQVVCNSQTGQTLCGSICCSSSQYCQSNGQCGETFAGSSQIYSYSTTPTVTAFIRPTSATVVTVTSVGSATTTVPFQTPVSTAAVAGMSATVTNKGLSGGAIAGIVIGVIAGLFLLFLLLGCLCCKGLIDGLLDLLGLRTRRRRRETIIEERYSHHGRTSGGATGGAGGGGAGGRTWFGAASPPRTNRPPKKSGGGLGGFTGVAAGLAALAVLLGLKRRRDRRTEKESYSSESSYTYSDYTSASSESSDRRGSRRSRR